MTSRGISGCERERNYMVAGLHAHETCSGVFSIRTPGIRICPYVLKPPFSLLLGWRLCILPVLPDFAEASNVSREH